MRKTTRVIAAMLTVLMLAALCPTVFAETGTKIRNPGHRGTLCTALSEQAETYYTGDYTYQKLRLYSGAADCTTSYAAAQNNELYDALYELMSSTQTKSYNYSSLSTDFAYTDCEDGASDGTMTCTWTGRSAVWNGSYYNREHVWPKSHASFYQQNGGADRHHLRPVSAYVNQTPHWHRPFGNAQDGKEVFGETGLPGGWYTDSYFEPIDSAKGDTARILLYVYVRWQQPNLYSDLKADQLPAFDRDDSANDGCKVIADLDTLLAWCEADPVDTWEMGRNDAAERIQGNRNVFVDYPELAWLLFGQKVPATMQTPSGNVCTHVWSGQVTVQPTCTQAGEQVKTCKLCTAVETEEVEALGHEFVGGICSRCGTKDADYKPTDPCEGYTDIDRNSWYHTAADFVIAHGLMGSTTTDSLTFAPRTSCTRAMIASVLYSLAGKPEAAFEPRFPDVREGQWYTKAVMWAYRNGIVAGYDNGSFGPNDNVTREQMAVILKAYTEKIAKKDTSETANLSQFPDASKVIWSKPYVGWAVAEGLLSGKAIGAETYLDPQGEASRAEVAAILRSFHAYLSK